MMDIMILHSKTSQKTKISKEQGPHQSVYYWVRLTGGVQVGKEFLGDWGKYIPVCR